MSIGGMPQTSFLLLHGQLVPVNLHSVPQGHPQIGLLLRRHALPSPLNVRECRVGNSVRLTRLLVFADAGDGWGAQSTGADGGREEGG
jgi:hypothetical protein